MNIIQRRILGLCSLLPIFAAPLAGADTAADLKARAGFTGGIIVQLDAAGSALSADLAAGEGVQLHVLEKDEKALAATRAALFATGDYGRAAALSYDGKHLPYADNLINLIVSEGATTVADAELLRVLRPLGKAVVDGRVVTKPWPQDIDEWNHFLHGPDNNAVARDKRVGQPRSMQWVATPKWSRSHEEMASMSAMVTAKGRMFAIFDSAPLASIRFNSSWKLIGRDAFNGTLLWERDIPVWNDHLRHFRSGPVHLPRRLIAVEDDVFVTLGLGAPVSHLDAATGRTIKTFEETEYAEELLYDQGRLYVVVGSSEIYRQGGGLFARNEPEATDFRFIAAYDPRSGGRLWRLDFKQGDFLLPQTVGTKGDTLCYQSTFGMGCVDAATGELRWRVARPTPARRMAYSSPTLVMTDDVVICSDREPKSPGDAAQEGKVTWGVQGWNEKGFNRKEPNKVRAYSLKDGRELWQADGTEGYNSPVDVFVIKDVAYIGTKFKGYDLKSGKVVKEVDTKADPVSMPHPRCHRYKATEDFIITGRSGVEFIDLNQQSWVGNNSWMRGTCQYGVMPANGMIYVPPDACGCNPTVKVPGLFAARARHTPTGHIDFPAQPVLVKGPAFGKPARAIRSGDWPMYRHDNRRSGVAPVEVADELKPSWSTKIGGKLTQAVVADGLVFVASVDQYTVYALSRRDGSIRWQYSANARVDSAPTWHAGRLIFGSADGWVYSLDAQTGELAWKFRGAPEERFVNVYGRMESLWPVHGSVIVQNNRLWFTAGRSSYMDGGIIFYQLDPLTGEQFHRSVLYHLDPDTDKELFKEAPKSFDMVGCSSDILCGDGERVFLKHLAFDRDGKEAKTTGPHLYSVTGMLDEEWFERAYWRYGENHGAGWSRWAQAGGQLPFGRIMCVDGDRCFAYGREKVLGGPTGHQTDSYHLFCSDSRSRPPTPEELKAARRGKKKNQPVLIPPDKQWSNKNSITVRAMAVGRDKIVVAGPVDLGRKTDHLAFANPDEARDAFEGEKDVFLQLVDKDSGAKLFELKISEYPSFDGLSLATGQVFLSTRAGVLTCFGG